MSARAEHVKIWRERTKQRIVDAFGGKCGICGYCRCQDSLDLHHINPEEKDFSFGKMRANPKNWNTIVLELRKCCLICANCHREVHQGMTKIPVDIRKFDEDFADYRRIDLTDKTGSTTNECPICKTKKPIWQQSCSKACGLKLKGKYDWNKFDLNDLFIIQKKSISEISRIVGCSCQGVIKRLKKEGLYEDRRKPSINWPTKEAFEIMVKEKSLQKISEELGCSHTGLRKRLKSLGIKWFYPGYWQKREFNKI